MTKQCHVFKYMDYCLSGNPTLVFDHIPKHKGRTKPSSSSLNADPHKPVGFAISIWICSSNSKYTACKKNQGKTAGCASKLTLAHGKRVRWSTFRHVSKMVNHPTELPETEQIVAYIHSEQAKSDSALNCKALSLLKPSPVKFFTQTEYK